MLLPSQSESRPPGDPLSLQSRPTEAPSQVDQLWDLLDTKSADQKKYSPVQASENTAFSPVTTGADRNVKNRPSSAFQLSSLDNQLSANQMLSQLPVQPPASPSQPRPGPNISQNSRGLPTAVGQSNQFIPSLLPTTVALPQSMVQTQLPQSMVQTQLPQSMVQMQLPQSMVQTQLPQPNKLHSQKSSPLVASTAQIHEHIPQVIPGVQPSQQLTTQHLARYPPPSQPPMQAPTIQPIQSLPLHAISQPNPSIQPQAINQPNPPLPLQSIGQPNPSIPMQSAQQLVPMQHSLQTGMHPPVQPHPPATLQPAIQSNPQIPTHTQSAVHPSHIPPPLNPQQQAYLQMLQKQLTSGSNPNLTPEQLAAIQTQLQRLS